jgi:hypothetical protein
VHLSFVVWGTAHCYLLWKHKNAKYYSLNIKRQVVSSCRCARILFQLPLTHQHGLCCCWLTGWPVFGAGRPPWIGLLFQFQFMFPLLVFFLLFPVGSVALASGNETATPLDAHSAPVKRDGMTVGAGAGQTWTRSHSV